MVSFEYNLENWPRVQHSTLMRGFARRWPGPICSLTADPRLAEHRQLHHFFALDQQRVALLVLYHKASEVLVSAASGSCAYCQPQA